MDAKMLTMLAKTLGKQQATHELRWMKAAQGDLARMVTRRAAGEPLQYILGP